MNNKEEKPKRSRGGSTSEEDRWKKGREINRKVTKLRQKRVIDNFIGSGGRLAESIRKAGYSEAYAQNSNKILETKSFQELLQEYLPDDRLLKKHNELLEKLDNNGDIDVNSVKSGLDMAYKLKGAYKDNLQPSQQLNQFNFYNLKPEDVNRRLQELREREGRASSGDGKDLP